MINLCAEQIVLYNNPSINIPTQEQILAKENVSTSISIVCSQQQKLNDILLNLGKTNCIFVRAYTHVLNFILCQ